MDRPLIGSSGRSGMRQSATLTAPLLLLTLVLGAAAAPAQAQDDLLHRGSQARLDPPAAELTATAVNKTRRRLEQMALRNLDDLALDSDAVGYDGLGTGQGRAVNIADTKRGGE